MSGWLHSPALKLLVDSLLFIFIFADFFLTAFLLAISCTLLRIIAFSHDSICTSLYLYDTVTFSIYVLPTPD